MDDFYVIDLYSVCQVIVDACKDVISILNSVYFEMYYYASSTSEISWEVKPSFWTILLVFAVIDLVVFALFRDYPD